MGYVEIRILLYKNLMEKKFQQAQEDSSVLGHFLSHEL